MFAFVSLPKSSSPSSSSTSGFGKRRRQRRRRRRRSSRFLRRRRRRVFKATKKKDEDDEDDYQTRYPTNSQRRGRNFTNKDDDFDDNVDVDDALRPSGATKPMDVSTPRKRRERRQFEEILAVERGERQRNDAQINRARIGIGRDAIGG